MRTYTIKGKMHCVYEPGDSLPGYLSPVDDYMNAKVGDWVKADDDCIIQILRRKKLGDKLTVGTCTGTYYGSMDTVKRADIYNMSGVDRKNVIYTRKKVTKNEILFSKRIAGGQDPVEAYLDVYPAKSEKYAKRMSALLLKTERVDSLVREELKGTFDELGVDLNYLIGVAKDITDGAKNDSDRIRTLSMLWDAYGVVEKQKITNVTGIFQGITENQLEAAQRPELPENV